MITDEYRNAVERVAAVDEELPATIDVDAARQRSYELGYRDAMEDAAELWRRTMTDAKVAAEVDALWRQAALARLKKLMARRTRPRRTTTAELYAATVTGKD